MKGEDGSKGEQAYDCQTHCGWKVRKKETAKTKSKFMAWVTGWCVLSISKIRNIGVEIGIVVRWVHFLTYESPLRYLWNI